MANHSYTAFLAFTRLRFGFRTQPRCWKPSKSAVVDKLEGFLSIITFALITVINICCLVSLIPSFVLSYHNPSSVIYHLFRKEKDKDAMSNISTSFGSRTAIATLNGRTLMFRFGSGPDYLAPYFMKRLDLFGAVLGGSFVTKIMNSMSIVNYKLTKRIYQDQIGALYGVPMGKVSPMQARTCWFDDVVIEFIDRNQRGERKVNMVILGAGYDTRASRLDMRDSRPHVRIYEVDTLPTQSSKCKLIEEILKEESNVNFAEMNVLRKGRDATTFVSCDFEKENWMECLKQSGFDTSLPTIIVFEGVSMYLARETIKKTLELVKECGEGSCIGMDYMDSSWAMTPALKKRTKRAGEEWLFGMCGNEPEELVNECEMYVLDHLRREEMVKRYLVKHYDGRPIGHLGDFGGFLLVGKNNH